MSFKSTSLEEHLDAILLSKNRPALARSVIPSLLKAIGGVAEQLRSAQQVSAIGSSNSFGDEQLNVDVLAEKIIREEIEHCPTIATASSEEDPVERPVRSEEKLRSSTAASGPEIYTIAFDPLDGSSIIAPNWTVGTIIGVWEGDSALGGSPASQQVVSILGVFGPRTTAIVAVRVPEAIEPTCFELGLVQTGDTTTCEIVRPEVKLSSEPFKTRYFAPANLRSAAENEKYAKLINHYITQNYTLRYCGGLVPDIIHALVKGHGVYVSPVTEKNKAKLRRLFELVPIALIIECAGGKAIDPTTGEDILATPILDCDERGGLVCGTAQEVSFVKQSFGM
jgi:sedoheptulose-bisphosphatase